MNEIIRGSIGVVIIGRNEEERLEMCLVSVLAQCSDVVYVDSASTDSSAAIAERMGVPVVRLPQDDRLNAAYARNAGVTGLERHAGPRDLIQFLDGDCRLADGWVESASAFLASRLDVAAVCGWRLEERPTRNIFHRICSVEWRLGGQGDVHSFAGEVMIRADVYHAQHGYDERLIAGEEPELSDRIRSAGGRIVRLDVVASHHDIDMTSWREWWRRSVRAGYSYAQVTHLDRRPTIYRGAQRKTLLWGGLVPLVALVSLPRTRLPMLAALGKACTSGWRAARRLPSSTSNGDRVAWALSCALWPLAGSCGVIRYWRDVFRGDRSRIIEYKVAT